MLIEQHQLIREDTHESARNTVQTLLGQAQAGELWVVDRHFCTRALLGSWHEAQATFIVREHGRHPRLAEQEPWRETGCCEAGQLYEQRIAMADNSPA